MKSVILKPGTDEYDTLFPGLLPWTGILWTNSDFVLETIRKLMTSDSQAYRIAPLIKVVGDLENMLTYLKPLFIYVAAFPMSYITKDGKKLLSSLVDLIEKAICVTYSLMVVQMDEEMVFLLKNMIINIVEENEIMEIYLITLRVPALGFSKLGVAAPLPSELYLLDNLIKLLESNINHLNVVNSLLYEELMHFRAFIVDLKENSRLKKLHFLKDSIEAVYSNSIGILCSCYVEENEDNVGKELNDMLSDVVNLIKHTKSKINLNELFYYPRVDDLGFLERFLESTRDLLKGQQISILKNEIETLHWELYSLVSSYKMNQEKFNKSLWERTVHLAYQADYVIDLYIVNPTDCLISSLCNIVEQVKSIRRDVTMEYLVKGERDRNVILVVESPSTLSMILYNDASIVQHFDVRAYCTVSQSYRKRELLLKILGNIVGHTVDISAFNTERLAKSICICLKQKRYLIVLADVCDIEVWNDLSQCLPDDRTHSRVLITTRHLDAVASKINATGCKVGDVHGRRCLAQDVARTYSHVHDFSTQENNVMVGFNKEFNAIKGHLLGSNKELEVISILGMAGVGKTTLAMCLYKDVSIASHFDIRARCVVSQTYNKMDLLLTILEQCSPSNDYDMDEQDLADLLCRRLKQGTYFIVIDDIWDIDVWNDLKRYLPDKKQGSRILITTRYDVVASETKSKIHSLSLLEEEESWELFKKKLSAKEILSGNLLRFAKTITKRCKGLPLSITIIAGLLSGLEKTEDKWNQIAECVTTSILDDPHGNCKAILELSYNHLPDHLRSCFLYLGAFKEDQEISLSRLTGLWIAEGLVKDTESKSSEDVAKEYMEDLIFRNLVIVVEHGCDGGVKTCCLHDLLHDFCLRKGEDENFMMVLDNNSSYSRKLLKDPHRLSINWYKDIYANPYHGVEPKLALTKVLGAVKVGPIDICIKHSYHSVRSVFVSDINGYYDIDLLIESYDMVLLKVLEVHGLEVDAPSSLSRLVHLRYLAIWGTLLKSSILLSSITKLLNLQILILVGSNDVLKLPYSLWNLSKLRHVHIRPGASLHVDCNRLLQDCPLLESLHSLSKIYLPYDLQDKLMRRIPNLRQLSCKFFESPESLGNSPRFPILLGFLDKLTTLKVEYGPKSWNMEMLELKKMRCQLHLPHRLTKLKLSGFELTSDDILEIGSSVPHLQVLKLYNTPMESWSVNDGEFPSLKVLKLECLGLSLWTASEDSFPCLEKLFVNSCENLEEIPASFGYIVTLSLILVSFCKPSVNDSAREIERVQQDEMQNSELHVHISVRSNQVGGEKRFVEPTGNVAETYSLCDTGERLSVGDALYKKVAIKRTIRVPVPQRGNVDVPPEDGFTWRKYGKKRSMFYELPRAYYRCKFHNCRAKKEVHLLNDDPFTFEVTYKGDHQCHLSPIPFSSS